MMPALVARASCGQWSASLARWTLNERVLPRTASTHCTEHAQRICESGEHAATALTKTSETLPNRGTGPHHLPIHFLRPTMPRIATTGRRGARAAETASVRGRQTLPIALHFLCLYPDSSG